MKIECLIQVPGEPAATRALFSPHGELCGWPAMPANGPASDVAPRKPIPFEEEQISMWGHIPVLASPAWAVQLGGSCRSTQACNDRGCSTGLLRGRQQTDGWKRVGWGGGGRCPVLFPPGWPYKREWKLLGSSWSPKSLTVVKCEEDSLCLVRD